MIEQIVRDCVVADRLARGLSEYYARRSHGTSCPDPLPPEQRASINSRNNQRLQRARMFVRTLHS